MVYIIHKLIIQEVFNDNIYNIGKLACASTQMYQTIKHIVEKEDNLLSKKLKILINYSKYPNKGMEISTSYNYQDLIDFYIKIGANLWNIGIKSAAEAGYIDLINFFLTKIAEEKMQMFTIFNCERDIDITATNILKNDNYLLNMGLLYGAKGGHLHIVKFFIENGADDLSYAHYAATKSDNQIVIEYLDEKLKLNTI
jgi:hypothetical protein